MVQSTAASVAPVSTMACAMLFGTIIFATAAMALRGYLNGDHMLFKTAANPRSTALDVHNINSMYTLLYHSSVLGLILFYAYICEYHPPMPIPKKITTPIFFSSLHSCYLLFRHTLGKSMTIAMKSQLMLSILSME